MLDAIQYGLGVVIVIMAFLTLIDSRRKTYYPGWFLILMLVCLSACFLGLWVIEAIKAWQIHSWFGVGGCILVMIFFPLGMWWQMTGREKYQAWKRQQS